jgi:hypothetical protein
VNRNETSDYTPTMGSYCERSKRAAYVLAQGWATGPAKSRQLARQEEASRIRGESDIEVPDGGPKNDEEDDRSHLNVQIGAESTDNADTHPE